MPLCTACRSKVTRSYQANMVLNSLGNRGKRERLLPSTAKAHTRRAALRELHPNTLSHEPRRLTTPARVLSTCATPQAPSKRSPWACWLRGARGSNHRLNSIVTHGRLHKHAQRARSVSSSVKVTIRLLGGGGGSATTSPALLCATKDVAFSSSSFCTSRLLKDNSV